MSVEECTFSHCVRVDSAAVRMGLVWGDVSETT